jgi:hypothetical protein
LKHNVTATGRQLGVVPAPIHGLWQIRYVDGRSGSIPEKLSGKYTGTRFAQEDLTDFISQTWDIVQEQIDKSARKSKKQEVTTEVAA